jgi:capsule polysaccharide export protein KpsE/RkpR
LIPIIQALELISTLVNGIRDANTALDTVRGVVDKANDSGRTHLEDHEVQAIQTAIAPLKMNVQDQMQKVLGG